MKASGHVLDAYTPHSGLLDCSSWCIVGGFAPQLNHDVTCVSATLQRDRGVRARNSGAGRPRKEYSKAVSMHDLVMLGALENFCVGKGNSRAAVISLYGG